MCIRDSPKLQRRLDRNTRHPRSPNHGDRWIQTIEESATVVLAAVRIRPNIARMVGKFPPAYELTTRPCTIRAGHYRWVITANGKPVQTSMNSFETPAIAHTDGRVALEKLVKSSRIGQ